MGSGVKGEWVANLVQRQVPGPALLIRGPRLRDANHSDPMTGLDSEDGAVACAGEYRSWSAADGLPAWTLLCSIGCDGSAHMRRHDGYA